MKTIQYPVVKMLASISAINRCYQKSPFKNSNNELVYSFTKRDASGLYIGFDMTGINDIMIVFLVDDDGRVKRSYII